MARYLYSELASLITARTNCAQPKTIAVQVPIPDPLGKAEVTVHRTTNEPKNPEWLDRHTDIIEALVKQHLPSGSGYDSGTKIDLDASTGNKLVFTTAFHHMNEGGYYDGWTEHTVTVTPSLAQKFYLRISGRNRNDIKEMMYQDFDAALHTDVTYDLYEAQFPDKKLDSYWKFSCPHCKAEWDTSAELTLPKSGFASSGAMHTAALSAHECIGYKPGRSFANEKQVWISPFNGKEFPNAEQPHAGYTEARNYIGQQMYDTFMTRGVK
jgi:hypothetical protein